MAQTYFGAYRGTGEFSTVAGTDPVVQGSSSTAGTDVEIRISTLDGAGNAITREDAALLIDKIQRFFLNTLQSGQTFPGI